MRDVSIDCAIQKGYGFGKALRDTFVPCSFHEHVGIGFQLLFVTMQSTGHIHEHALRLHRWPNMRLEWTGCFHGRWSTLPQSLQHEQPTPTCINTTQSKQVHWLAHNLRTRRPAHKGLVLHLL